MLYNTAPEYCSDRIASNYCTNNFHILKFHKQYWFLYFFQTPCIIIITPNRTTTTTTPFHPPFIEIIISDHQITGRTSPTYPHVDMITGIEIIGGWSKKGGQPTEERTDTITEEIIIDMTGTITEEGTITSHLGRVKVVVGDYTETEVLMAIGA